MALAVPVMVGVMVEMWLCEFLLPGDYGEERALNSISQRPPCQDVHVQN